MARKQNASVEQKKRLEKDRVKKSYARANMDPETKLANRRKDTLRRRLAREKDKNEENVARMQALNLNERRNQVASQTSTSQGNNIEMIAESQRSLAVPMSQ